MPGSSFVNVLTKNVDVLIDFIRALVYKKLNIDGNNQYSLMDRLKVFMCLLLACYYIDQCHCDFPKVMRCPRSEGSNTSSGKAPPLSVLVLSQKLIFST